MEKYMEITMEIKKWEIHNKERGKTNKISLKTELNFIIN